MRTLRRLVRYHRHLLDENRRALAELEAREARIRGDIECLEASVVAEQQAARLSVEGLAAYGSFAREAIAKRGRLNVQRAEAGAAVLEARDRVLDAFAEAKRYEITLERRVLDAEQELAARDRADLEEIALGRHRRRAGD